MRLHGFVYGAVCAFVMSLLVIGTCASVYAADGVAKDIHVVTAVIDSITPAPALWGQSVTFTGHGEDSDVGHTFLAHEWRSDLDGAIGSAASFSTSALTRGDHTIEYRVQCSDLTWSSWTPWGSNPLEIGNTPPTQPTVDVTPDNPLTSDDLQVAVSGSIDSDGDPISYDYDWFKNSVYQAAYDDLSTLPSSATVKGDVWRCVVTPEDPFDEGPAGEDTVTVGNAPPTQPTVVITPANPLPGDALRADAASTDADGDPVTYSYQWFKNGTLQPGRIYRTLAARWTSRGQLWTCVVTPNDGTVDGPTGQDAVLVGDIPSAPTVTITPGSPNTSQAFTCNASGSIDPDGNPVTYGYQWFKDGVLQVGVTWRTIGATRTQPGQVWRCVVTPNDGTHDGPTGEASVTVNGPPSAPTVVINPDDPTTKQDLVANATSSIDPDAEAVSYRYEWFKNGVAQPDLTGMRIIRAWRTQPGQVWRCVVTPTDGVNDGPAGEATVIINTPPGPPTVAIWPQWALIPFDKPFVPQPVVTDDLVAVVLNCVDPDGDAITYTFQWYRNGVVQPGVVWRGIGSWRTHLGDEWKVVVTPSDLHGEGKPGEAIVTILDGQLSGPVSVSSLAVVPTAVGAELTFALSADAAVTCEVLNIAGRAVRTIVTDRQTNGGLTTLTWDGRNASGLAVPGGTYLVRITASGASGSRCETMGAVHLVR